MQLLDGKSMLIIGCIYRPPNSDVECFLGTLSEILHVVKTEYYSSTVILHGDFNMDMFSSSAGGLCSEYLSLMYCNNLVPTILRPTRVGKSLATLIDNIFTDCFNFKLSGIIITIITDHYAVFNSILLESNSIDDGYVTITKRTMNDLSMNLLSECVAGHNWETIKSIDSVEEAYNTFIVKFKELYDHNCPLKTFKVKKIRYIQAIY